VFFCVVDFLSFALYYLSLTNVLLLPNTLIEDFVVLNFEILFYFTVSLHS